MVKNSENINLGVYIERDSSFPSSPEGKDKNLFSLQKDPRLLLLPFEIEINLTRGR